MTNMGKFAFPFLGELRVVFTVQVGLVLIERQQMVYTKFLQQLRDRNLTANDIDRIDGP